MKDKSKEISADKDDVAKATEEFEILLTDFQRRKEHGSKLILLPKC